MIPKIIHYIWLGGKPLPEIVEKCIESWKRFCPDYEIKRWDESNLNLDVCKYARQAYDAKKYAFASDVLRFQLLKEYGGIYLDVDVELLKPLDDLLEQKCFMGLEKWGEKISVAPGLIVGSEKNGKVVSGIFKLYQNDRFLNKDGSINLETVCNKTTQYLLKEYGLKNENILQTFEDITIYPAEYFCPIDGSKKEVLYLTENSYSKHLYLASWVTKPTFATRFKIACKKMLRKILGTKNYLKLKNKVKGNKND